MNVHEEIHVLVNNRNSFWNEQRIVRTMLAFTSFKSLHAVLNSASLGSPLLKRNRLGSSISIPYYIPLGSPLLKRNRLRNYRPIPYYIPLGSPLLKRNRLGSSISIPYYIPLGSPLLKRNRLENYRPAPTISH